MIFDIIAQFFRKLFGSVETTEPEPEPPDTPISASGTSGETIEVSLFETIELASNNGRVPEQMVAVYLAKALDKTPHGYEIRFGFNPVNVSTQKAVCSDDSAFEEWPEMANNMDDPLSKDSNVLITNVDGGGCGYVRGKCATAPGANLDERRRYRSTGSDDWHGAIQSNLHEIAHNLGASHDHNDDRFGKQHPGKGWNNHINESWHYTPSVAGNGAPNICGEKIEEREYEKGIRHHKYHSCFIDEILTVK